MPMIKLYKSTGPLGSWLEHSNSTSEVKSPWQNIINETRTPPTLIPLQIAGPGITTYQNRDFVILLYCVHMAPLQLKRTAEPAGFSPLR
jgi:hypothetical protein